MHKSDLFDIPPTLMKLGLRSFEDLLIIGLDRPITTDDIFDLIIVRKDMSKRTARALTKIVDERDLDDFNDILDELRHTFSSTDRLRIDSDYYTGTCNIFKRG